MYMVDPQVAFVTNKPVVVVKVEGTLRSRETDEPIADAVAAVELLREGGAYVVLVSAEAHTSTGLQFLNDWIVRNSIPYDEVWASFGIPPADQWYDNEAMTL